MSKSGNSYAGRGFLLLGPEFHKNTHHACACDDEVCLGMGFTYNMFTFPSDAVIRLQWFKAMGNQLRKETKQKINQKPSKFQLTHWHFHQCHLITAEDNRLKVRRQSTYKDNKNKVWATKNHPPPNSLPKAYKDRIEAEKSPLPQDRSSHEQTLPVWIESMRYCESMGTKQAKNVTLMQDQMEAAIRSKAAAEERVASLLKKVADVREKATIHRAKIQQQKSEIKALQKENKRFSKSCKETTEENKTLSESCKETTETLEDAGVLLSFSASNKKTKRELDDDDDDDIV